MAATKSVKPKTVIRPLGDRVLVRRFDTAAQSEGGIILPEAAQETQTKGEIVAVGPGKKLNRAPSYEDVRDPLDPNGGAPAPWPRIPLDVKVGDHILFTPYGQETIKQGDDELVLIREEDVLAVLESV